jgi:hypothetical protein
MWTQYFSCSGGTSKNHTQSSLEHVITNFFFHPVGFVAHIMHSAASGPQNIDALFFILRWDRYRVDQKCVRTHIMLN